MVSQVLVALTALRLRIAGVSGAVQRTDLPDNACANPVLLCSRSMSGMHVYGRNHQVDGSCALNDPCLSVAARIC